jgi:chemotaxis regulatin CheY-phosphate phosphatase CheZ
VNPFFSIATLFLSIAVVVIAWQQWRVAKNKLRLDLFDRRYKVYDATRKFLAEIQQDATFTDSQLNEFKACTSDTEFLFGRDVVDYLAQIRKRALDMRLHQKLFEPLPVGAERSHHVQAYHDELLWLTNQLTAMTQIFAPYLGFSHIH